MNGCYSRCYNLNGVITLAAAIKPSTVKVTTVGNSTGIVLPKELLDKLRVQKGDVLHVLETPNGLELTPWDPVFAAQMEVAERVMRKDRDLLRR